MLAKRIIACLDVKGGRVVKGRKFVALKDAGEPAALAAKYAAEGADEIVFLDIAASSEGRGANRQWIAETAEKLNVPFTVGGGISSNAQMREVLRLGADKISVNTAAIKLPRLIAQAAKAFGSQCVVVAIDAKKSGERWEVYAQGGMQATGKDAIEWAIQCEKLGAGEILLTSIDRDGTRKGFDCELTRKIAERVNIPVIASGGAGSEEDFLQVFNEGKADAALAAGIFHYGKIRIAKLKNCLSDAGIPVRLV